MKIVSQWRTVLVVAYLGLVLLVGLLVCAAAPPELGARAFDTLAWSVLGLAAVAAGKSSVEHLAGGGGVKGALSTLLTPAKPEPPPTAMP